MNLGGGSSMVHILILEKSVQKTREWLHKIEKLARWENSEEAKALAFLRSTLHELRDNLLIDDLAHFSSQLPIIIRGLLFEQWNPNYSTLRDKKREDFLYGIYTQLPDLYKDENIGSAVQAVMSTIAAEIDRHEIVKLQKILPHGIGVFFDKKDEY